MKRLRPVMTDWRTKCEPGTMRATQILKCNICKCRLHKSFMYVHFMLTMQLLYLYFFYGNIEVYASLCRFLKMTRPVQEILNKYIQLQLYDAVMVLYHVAPVGHFAMAAFVATDWVYVPTRCYILPPSKNIRSFLSKMILHLRRREYALYNNT